MPIDRRLANVSLRADAVVGGLHSKAAGRNERLNVETDQELVSIFVRARRICSLVAVVVQPAFNMCMMRCLATEAAGVRSSPDLGVSSWRNVAGASGESRLRIIHASSQTEFYGKAWPLPSAAASVLMVGPLMKL